MVGLRMACDLSRAGMLLAKAVELIRGAAEAFGPPNHGPGGNKTAVSGHGSSVSVVFRGLSGSLVLALVLLCGFVSLGTVLDAAAAAETNPLWIAFRSFWAEAHLRVSYIQASTYFHKDTDELIVDRVRQLGYGRRQLIRTSCRYDEGLIVVQNEGSLRARVQGSPYFLWLNRGRLLDANYRRQLQGLLPDPPLYTGRDSGFAEVTYRGIRQVEGRDAHVLRGKLPGGVIGSYWIDAESYLLLREERQAPDGHPLYEMVRFQVHYDSTVPDSIIELHPTADELLVTDAQQWRELVMLEWVERSISWRLLFPSFLPEGYTLEGVRLAVFRDTQVLIMRFVGPPGDLLSLYEWEDASGRSTGDILKLLSRYGDRLGVHHTRYVDVHAVLIGAPATVEVANSILDSLRPVKLPRPD